MTARLIDFSPVAWNAYQAVRRTDSGPAVRHALQRIASEPKLARAELLAVRYQVVEERLPRTPEVWGLEVQGPDGSRWLIVWREMPYVVEVGHLGAAPLAAVADAPATW